MSQPRAARELRVMTFNLRVRTILDGPNIWDRRRELVVQRVRAFDPHLLGTQARLAPHLRSGSTTYPLAQTLVGEVSHLGGVIH
jgi:hypothetical protein